MNIQKTLYGLLGMLVLLPTTALAHVRFIATDSDVAQYGGSDFAGFISPLSNPNYVWMIVVTIVVVLGLYHIITRQSWFKKWSARVVACADSYRNYIPWIIRLSLGILLIGMATGGHFISPVLAGNEFLLFIQILIGFFLMAGLLVEISALVVVVLYVVALWTDPYMIGSMDVAGMALSLLLLDGRRPGVDEIVGIPDFFTTAWSKTVVPVVMRVGIGVSLIYLAIVEKILNPHLSEYVVEVTKLIDVIPVSSAMWTFSAGIIELFLGILLVIGYKTRLVSVVAIVVLSLSFFYFGEDVSSHITLFGTLSAVFILGAGAWSLDNRKK